MDKDEIWIWDLIGMLGLPTNPNLWPHLSIIFFTNRIEKKKKMSRVLIIIALMAYVVLC